MAALNTRPFLLFICVLKVYEDDLDDRRDRKRVHLADDGHDIDSVEPNAAGAAKEDEHGHK